MDTSFIRGIIPPILTPIDENERIDEPVMRRHVDFVINGGVHGILAFGSNGEFYMKKKNLKPLSKNIKIQPLNPNPFEKREI